MLLYLLAEWNFSSNMTHTSSSKMNLYELANSPSLEKYHFILALQLAIVIFFVATLFYHPSSSLKTLAPFWVLLIGFVGAVVYLIFSFSKPPMFKISNLLSVFVMLLWLLVSFYYMNEHIAESHMFDWLHINENLYVL